MSQFETNSGSRVIELGHFAELCQLAAVSTNYCGTLKHFGHRLRAAHDPQKVLLRVRFVSH